MPKKKKNENKSQMKEQVKNCKQYLNLDLSSKAVGAILPYKFLLDSLTKALEFKEKTDEDSCNKLRELYLSVNKENYDIKISNIKKKMEKPLKSDLDEANEVFNQRNKEYEEKQNFHKKLVEKGNKIQEDRNEMIKKSEEARQKLINDSNDYVKDLQQQTDPNNPERKKLLEENENLKKQIQDTIQEGLKMKDDFDKMLQQSGLALDQMQKGKEEEIKDTLNKFQEKTTNQIFANTQLKTELLQLKQRNEEFAKFKISAENQCKQFEAEIKNKQDESLKLSYENMDMQNRIQESTKNKTEVLNLMKEEILSAMNCAVVGRVLRWDEGKQTVDVQPMGRKRVSAGGKMLGYPVLREVPVFFPVIKMKEILRPGACPYDCPCYTGGSDCSCKHKVRLDIRSGDLCLVFFCDVNTDGWEGGNGGNGAARHHDLADGFAIVGFHTQGRLE